MRWLEPFLNGLVVRLADGGFKRASETTPSITGIRDRRFVHKNSKYYTKVQSDYYPNMSISPPPSAQLANVGSFTGHQDHNNIEEHVQEGDHGDLDLEHIEDWELKNSRLEFRAFVPKQIAKIHPRTLPRMSCPSKRLSTI